MKEYFGLQYSMMNRRLKDAGAEPLLAYIIITVIFIGLSVFLFYKTEFAVYIYSLFVLTLTGKLSETRRTEFLKICFGDSKLKKIRIAENFLVAFPFLLFLIYKQLFLPALILLLLSSILAIVNFSSTLNFTIPTPFSKRPFEFSTGFRNTFYLILAAYALTFTGVFVNNFNLAIFALLFVFATTLSYYSTPENEYYIWIYNLNAKMFLMEKIKTAIQFSSFLCLPMVLIISIFFYHNITITLLFFLLGEAFLVCMIVSKYAAYPDELNITQGILISICIGFPPLLIVLIPYLFSKSENRLSPLLK